ncbi:MAG: hypothetical protein JXM70_04975 [Pirellulales bacterium]|nr:hypothetical protein [Pirellulales bacterium]
MGWGRTLLLGDIGNRLDIEDTERDIAHLKQKMAGVFRNDMSQDQKMEVLVRENTELKLCLAALVRLLLAKGAIDKTELETMVAALDAQDGNSDGKYDGQII